MIYPWQKQHWERFLRSFHDERLPHAILLSGPPAIGKLGFCLSCIQRINCVQPTQDNYACGVCSDCRLLKAGTHPDVRMLNVDENVDQIKVNDIREIDQFVSLSRQQGLYKAVCINQADRMNIHAANALLKTLEEPPPGAVLFLISNRINTLLATIRSRCQFWRFELSDRQLALNWLQQQDDNPNWENVLSIAGDRPLFALELHETGLGRSRLKFYSYVKQLMLGKGQVTEFSIKLQDEELEQLIVWQQSWCTDLLRCFYSEEPVTLENPDFQADLRSLASQVSLQPLFRYLDKLIEFRRFSNTALNRRLFIEDMLIRCQEILK